MNREELIKTLGSTDKKATSKKIKSKTISSHEDVAILTQDVSKFWNGEAISDDIFGEVSIPSIAAALPKRLGSFPLWRGDERFLDAMESIYERASTVGLRVFLGEQVNPVRKSRALTPPSIRS